ncbi:MAG: hypothetical protein R3F61_18710 [Myxococcota bacterium]
MSTTGRVLAKVLTGAIALAWLAPGAALACDEAERLRLADEISNLAKKNAWSGVERKYGELLRTKCELLFEQYSLGAESAKNLGKTYEMYERLSAAEKIDPQEELTATLEQLNTNYGRVEVRGDARRRAALLREQMPFAPDQRKSIEYAQSVMEGTGSFKGMLPIGGPYKVADKEFSVEAGPDFETVVVGNGKGPKTTGGGNEGIEDQGLINWVGPIALIGTGFFGSGAPNGPIFKTDATDEELLRGTPIVGRATDADYPCGGYEEALVTDDAGQPACLPTIRQPKDISMFSTPNVDVTVGGEVGLTYRAPEMGVAATVNYRRMFGSRLNQITVWGAWVVRPGAARFALGPTWGVTAGKGNGYVDWVNEGQTEVFRVQRQSEAEYGGFGMGGGVAASAGYGVIELAGFQGLVELHGHFQRDNLRSYSGIGLRFGIVPKIDRFQG